MSKSETIKKLLESPQVDITPAFPAALFFFLLSALLVIAIGSFGIAALISLVNDREKNELTSFSVIQKNLLKKAISIFRLEALLIAIAVASGSLLAIPGDMALSQGLESLAQTLSLSALGLALSIFILLFFLRQYAAIYLALTNISLSGAIENAYRLFRLYAKETFLLSAFFLALETLFMLFLILTETFFNSVPIFSVDGNIRIFEWLTTLLFLSFFEAWSWASWTIFFRMIALPKEPEPILQKSETVLQQESAVSLDKA